VEDLLLDAFVVVCIINKVGICPRILDDFHASGCSEEQFSGPKLQALIILTTRIKKGRFLHEEIKKEFNQETFNESRIGSTDDLNFFDKAKAGASGQGYKFIIRRVYKKCCTLEESDEVWLFGFSRGAFIVRAVAGLLHHIGALQSDEQDFNNVYP